MPLNDDRARSLLSICLKKTGQAMLHWIENGYLLEQRIENLRRELIPQEALHQYNTKRFESLKRRQRHLIPSVTRTIKEIRFNKTLLKKMCKIKSGITVSRKFQYRILCASLELERRASEEQKEENDTMNASEIWSDEDDSSYTTNVNRHEYESDRVTIQPGNLTLDLKKAQDIAAQSRTIVNLKTKLQRLREERDTLFRDLKTTEKDLKRSEIVTRSRAARLYKMEEEQRQMISPEVVMRLGPKRESKLRSDMFHSLLKTADVSSQFLGKIKSCNALWCEPVSSEICAFQHLDKNTKEKKDDENDEETKIVPSLDIDLTDSHVRQVEIGIIAYVLRSGICRSLNLSRNRIGMDVLIPLLHELRFCDSLQVLDLSWNAIDHRCVKALCEVLIPRDRSEREIREETLVEEQSMTIPLYAYNKTLRSLSLAGNRVGYLGAISLNRVLKTHQCLCELNLFHSNLDAAGGKEISKSLRLNTVLRKLNLRFNNITQEGAKAIASALSENTTLKDLNLADNHFGRLGVMKLYHGLKKSRSFLDIARTIGYVPDTKIRVRGVSETQGK